LLKELVDWDGGFCFCIFGEVKNTIAIFILSFIFSITEAQQGMWTWVHGDTTVGNYVNYGVQGVPATTNLPAGEYEGCEWTDKNGKFWYFGGTVAYHNNLWKFDPLINMWTWKKGPGVLYNTGTFGVQGVPSPNNNPAARGYGPASWVDTSGNLWMYGGFHYIAAQYNLLNDLWKYDISTNMWTWMSGSSVSNQLPVHGVLGVPSIFNTLGARAELGCTWTDNENNLWLFGGSKAPYYWNDLWKYNIATNEWTWMKGDSTPQATGVYGTMGQPSPFNTPGARWTYSNWKDSEGNLWLFGGAGDGTCQATNNSYNDLWKYNINTNEWTWMKGANFPCDPGSRGIRCVENSSNNPGGRFENRSCWTDKYGKFWMFGGFSPPSSTLQNDLWTYDVGSNNWTWVWGDSLANSDGSFGFIGITSPCNGPAGTAGSVSWYDPDANAAYVYGGFQHNGSTSSFRNELWRYNLDIECIVPMCITDVLENEISINLIVFPNPAVVSFSISTSFSHAQLQIFNTLGTAVYQTTLTSKHQTLSPHLSSGIYFLRLSAGEKVYVQKLIIE
jgi:hypothetical protein